MRTSGADGLIKRRRGGGGDLQGMWSERRTESLRGKFSPEDPGRVASSEVEERGNKTGWGQIFVGKLLGRCLRVRKRKYRVIG